MVTVSPGESGAFGEATMRVWPIWLTRVMKKSKDADALQDDLTTSVVAAIEPSLRQAEIERVKRKRPDNLDAYDFLLRAMSEAGVDKIVFSSTCAVYGAPEAMPISEGTPTDPINPTRGQPQALSPSFPALSSAFS